MENGKILVGQTILKVAVSPDKYRIMFTLVSGAVECWEAFGDCCSQSWIEHVEMPNDLEKGARVLAVENVEHAATSISGWDVITYYGVKITTDRGYIDIDYRNSSNGYYGGWLGYRCPHGGGRYCDECDAASQAKE